MKYYVILISGMLLAEHTLSQTNEYDTESSYHRIDPAMVSQRHGYDLEPLDVKRFDEKQWKNVVGNENYSDGFRIRKPRQAIHDSTQTKTSKGKLRSRPADYDEPDDSEYESIPMSSGLLKIVFYVLAFGIIGFILFMIFKNITLKTNRKIQKSELPDVSAPIADIQELETDRLLREALASGNYRLAIRIYFLGLLKKLDENGTIVWKKDKTNRDYLSELFPKVNYFEDVKSLTRAYEKVWYGGHSLPLHSYEDIISSFKAIDEKINASKDR